MSNEQAKKWIDERFQRMKDLLIQDMTNLLQRFWVEKSLLDQEMAELKQEKPIESSQEPPGGTL